MRRLQNNPKTPEALQQVDLSDGLVAPAVANQMNLPDVSAKSRKTFKYGQCPQCKIARRPVVHQSGPHRGKVLARCGRWWQREGVKRMCWHFELSSGDTKGLPKDIQAQLE